MAISCFRVLKVEISNPEIGAVSLAISFRAKPKLLLLFQSLAILLGVASVVAALPVIVLSFGTDAAARLFAKIRPLRDTYAFLSRSYDRLIDRLARKGLRDPRDAPALRLMVSLTVTVVPIFVAQLVLGRPRVWLVIAFYLALYGLKFQRFVRMFSASHVEAHRRRGFFSDKYDKFFGRYLEFFVGCF